MCPTASAEYQQVPDSGSRPRFPVSQFTESGSQAGLSGEVRRRCLPDIEYQQKMAIIIILQPLTSRGNLPLIPLFA
jgi:hypothetical protein